MAIHVVLTWESEPWKSQGEEGGGQKKITSSVYWIQDSYLLFFWDFEFVALPIETGGRQPEEAEQFLDRLVKYAGSGDSSDEARFRHFAATSLMMTNQIGVARAILASL